jgi:hypothetical protein
VSLFTVLWIVWLVTFLAIEGIALFKKDRPGHPKTLSAHIWWLVRGAGPWHQGLRLVVAVFLGWLTHHFLS